MIKFKVFFFKFVRDLYNLNLYSFIKLKKSKNRNTPKSLFITIFPTNAHSYWIQIFCKLFRDCKFSFLGKVKEYEVFSPEVKGLGTDFQ